VAEDNIKGQAMRDGAENPIWYAVNFNVLFEVPRVRDFEGPGLGSCCVMISGKSICRDNKTGTDECDGREMLK
jgi:hypothetical protein